MIVNDQAFSSDCAVPSQLQPTEDPRTPTIQSILEQASTWKGKGKLGAFHQPA